MEREIDFPFLSKNRASSYNFFCSILIGLECSGVDYMSEDIQIPYDMNKGHIIEMNDMVDTKIHIDADEKQNPNLLFKNMVNTF